MVDGIPWPQLGIGSGWALVAVFVWALIAGKVVPRSTHDDVIHDRDEWRSESRLKDAQIAEKDKQLTHMGELGRLVEALMNALRRADRIGREGDES